jgi:hypothetical protein
MIGGTNRLVAGVRVTQKRHGMGSCESLLYTRDAGGKLIQEPGVIHSEVGDGLHSYIPSSTPFGKDPVFIRTSSLYDPSASLANYSAARLDMGMPLGFVPDMFSGLPQVTDFPVWFDTEITGARAAALLAYLKEGFYCDEATKQLTFELLVYNLPFKMFCVAKVDVKMDAGGLVSFHQQIIALQTYPYPRNPDGTLALTKAAATQVFLELVWLLFLCGSIVTKLLHIARDARVRTLREVWTRELQPWILIEWLSILLQLSICSIWLDYYLSFARDFRPMNRYDALASLDSRQDFLRLSPKYDEVRVLFDVVHGMAERISSYMSMNVISILLMLARLLRLLDFQPRLGLVTRTLWRATVELLHFGIVFTLVHFCFAAVALFSFGSSISRLSTFSVACSTLMEVVMGDTSLLQDLAQVPNPTTARLWFWSFIVVQSFVLINVLLAILVDAFIEVKREAANTPTVLHDLRALLPKTGKAKSCRQAVVGMHDVLQRTAARAAAEEAKADSTTSCTPREDRPTVRVGRSVVDEVVLTSILQRYSDEHESSQLDTQRLARAILHTLQDKVRDEAELADSFMDERAFQLYVVQEFARIHASHQGLPGRDAAQQPRKPAAAESNIARCGVAGTAAAPAGAETTSAPAIVVRAAGTAVNTAELKGRKVQV